MFQTAVEKEAFTLTRKMSKITAFVLSLTTATTAFPPQVFAMDIPDNVTFAKEQRVDVRELRKSPFDHK